MNGEESMTIRPTIVCYYLVFVLFGINAGCRLGEVDPSYNLPRGRLIPIEQIPDKILPEARRQALPEGTTIEHCDGDLYRFNYPDGSIMFRNSKGEDCGGLI